MKRFLILSIIAGLILSLPAGASQTTESKQPAQPANTAFTMRGQVSTVTNAPAATCTTVPPSKDYQVGPNDILDISVLQPEQLLNTVTVSPDGSITFPYIGTVSVKNKTLSQVQDDVQKRLSDGYMKYPVVSVSLKESHSRRFFVFGEVIKPGAYDIEENMTVLRGISMAGGFSQFGSASRVKVLRPKQCAGGYEVIKVNIKDVMDGVADADLTITQGDIIVVSEGIF